VHLSFRGRTDNALYQCNTGDGANSSANRLLRRCFTW